MKTKDKENLEHFQRKKGTLHTRQKYKFPMTSQQKHWRPKYCRMAYLKCQMKTTNCQPSILHGAKITFRNKGEMEAFSDEQKQR